MKFVKAIFFIVLLLSAVLLLIGFFVPEVDTRIETRVDKPIVSVFAGMMNVQDLTNWMEGLEEVKSTGGMLGLPGSTFEFRYKETETDAIYQVKVLEMSPLQSVRFIMYNDILEMTINVKFKAEGISTNVDTYMQMKGKGIVARSFLPLVKSVITEEAEQNLENFKRLQESK